MNKSNKLAKQITGTMAIEGMKLTKKEFELVRQCADGKKNSTKVIDDLIKKYKVN